MFSFFKNLLIIMVCIPPAFSSNIPLPLSDADFLPVDEKLAKIGQLLFFDKILSGNKNIACATCHHPSLGSTDRLSLGIGEGGEGLGPERTFGEGEMKAERRVPRNAPALWNLGAKEFRTLFHDGRISHSDIYPSGFDSPAEEFLPMGLSDIVAVQAMFPLTADVEMAGDKNENEIPSAATRRVDYAWNLIADRVRSISDYEQLFIEAIESVEGASDISIVHIANALSAFERFEFRADNSPFDQFLRGDKNALSQAQVRGMTLFYGKAQCSECHSGVLQTDHAFHNIGMPFVGPGRTRRFDFKARDMGRINESDYASDAYKFRTPSLRNITETSPYGHNGAYDSLRAMIQHHAQPIASFENYQLSLAALPAADHLKPDNLLWADQQEVQRMLSTLTPIRPTFTEEELGDILAFLESLRDESSLEGRLGVPDAVPSNLPIDR